MNIAVTGAFGYSGRYIAQRLLDNGHMVLTLTDSPRRQNPFGGEIRAESFHFDEPRKLVESLRGIDSLINTYWVRFDHSDFSHARAVANTKTLFYAARDAGVGRIVHISITNPDTHSTLPYFRSKAELEMELQSLGVSHCILRPTVLFGKEDILINNIAWALRHLPIFGLFGSGGYRLQPIYVDDLAAAAATKAVNPSDGNEVVNAIGPETFTYRQLVETIRRALGLIRPIVPLPPAVAYWGARLMGSIVSDIIVTREEIQGLLEDRLYVPSAPLGQTKLTEWISQHKQTLGRHYTSELARRRDRITSYQSN